MSVVILVEVLLVLVLVLVLLFLILLVMVLVLGIMLKVHIARCCKGWLVDWDGSSLVIWSRSYSCAHPFQECCLGVTHCPELVLLLEVLPGHCHQCGP